MKYLPSILIGLALGLSLYFVFFNQTPQQNETVTEQPVSPTLQGKWETKADDQPPVSVKVTPVEFGKNAVLWKFDIVFDTHSGSLDEDLLKVVVLSDDKGETYQPIRWEGSGPGGHHRAGVLVFEAINPLPFYVELKIINVGNIPERLFKWNVE